MKIIDPHYEIEKIPDGEGVLCDLEKCARTCYKSEERITPDSADKFLRKLLAHKPPHMSVIEHDCMRVRFVCDRGFTHELVRHRIASFSQESTRYCNYGKGKFGNEITVIKPCFLTPNSMQYDIWEDACRYAEAAYLDMLSNNGKPEEARSVLPNSLKTEIVMTANLRQWGHVFLQRTSPKAHPHMRELMIPLLQEVRSRIPVLYENLDIYG